MIFDHIGLFVRDLALGRDCLGAMLPVANWTAAVDDPLINVRVQFGTDPSGIRYELVAPLNPGGPVDAVLAQGTNILNHVCYRVPDLDADIRRLRAQRCMPTAAPRPAVAFGGRRVVFLLTPLRFILELVEDADADRQSAH